MDTSKGYDIPVVIFIFKREKILQVIERIKEVAPKKIYILADHGRNEDECKRAEICREKVEAAIDWDCEIIKNYADENRGVYNNIGEGAKWVLKREKWAIFLEDDNLPEVTFFDFCKEMLEKYETDNRVLWICGTNYLGEYKPDDNASYVFTKHMLPCGWASWANKFEKYYDGNLELCNDESVLSKIGNSYCNKKVYKQYRAHWMGEFERIKNGKKPVSWDYQMDFSIKANGLLGICPCRNQIKNIGVDDDSIHGGVSFTSIMTKRFCGMDSYAIDFPLVHPKTVLIDPEFEEKIGKIILYPWHIRVKNNILKLIRKVLHVPKGQHLKDYLRMSRR